MATLITVEQLRENFPFVIHSDVPDARLSYSIVSASARLKSWIGADVYELAITDENTVERRIILNNAEGHLALHYSLLGLNTNLRNYGLVAQEQVEGNTVNTYFQPEKVANFSSQFLELAREIAEPFALLDGTPSAGFIGIDNE